MLGPYKFIMQATEHNHGYSMYFGHYTTAVNLCEKTFIATKNTEGDIGDILTAYILVYKLTMECLWPDTMW